MNSVRILCRNVGFLRSRTSQFPRRNIKTSVRRQGEEEVWHYREPNICTHKPTLLKAEILMTGMWYWVLWHCWYDFGHLVGHHTMPDPAAWTDAQLGIPPDDED